LVDIRITRTRTPPAPAGDLLKIKAVLDAQEAAYRKREAKKLAGMFDKM